MPLAEIVPSTIRKGSFSDVGVVSLLDMLRFYAELFVVALHEVDEMAERWQPNDNVIPALPVVSGKLAALYTISMEHGLRATADNCARIMDKCGGRVRIPPITYREIVSDLKHLRETLEGELRGELFFHLSMKDADGYSNPRRGWEGIVSRFPRVAIDVEECSRCFALERHGAAVFHVLLVAEFGIIQVANLFNASGDRPGWGSLERLQRINDKKWNDKSDLERKHADFLKGVLPFAFAIKDSWRHKISHVDNKLEWVDTDFSPEVASEIISATRGFMRRIAEDLPK